MPVSDYHQISDVMHVVEQVKPRSVLDIGVGFGKWGMLCREVLDVYYGRVHKPSWSTRVDGVEIFEPYRNPLWSYCYDTVHRGDITALVSTLGHYDLMICCDVIEHFEKAEGKALVHRLLQSCGVLILTSPRGYHPQHAFNENEREEHKSGWERSDFVGMPHLYQEIGFTFMVVLSTSETTLASIKLRHPMDVLGVKKGIRALLTEIGRRLVFRFQASP